MTALPVTRRRPPVAAAGARPGTVRCTCGRWVRRVPTRAGALVLLELEPDDTGNVVPGRDDLGRLVADVLTEAAAARCRSPRWRPHLPTCRAAIPHPPVRSRPGGLELSNVRCPRCGRRLAVVLLRLAEASHPSC